MRILPASEVQTLTHIVHGVMTAGAANECGAVAAQMPGLWGRTAFPSRVCTCPDVVDVPFDVLDSWLVQV